MRGAEIHAGDLLAVDKPIEANHQLGTRAEWRYYLTSSLDAPAMLTYAICRHRAVEDSLHWVFNVVFREDDTRSRDQIATRNFAVLRKLVFNLLQQEKYQPGNLRTWRRNAGWNNTYPTRLLVCASENNRATAP